MPSAAGTRSDPHDVGWATPPAQNMALGQGLHWPPLVRYRPAVQDSARATHAEERTLGAWPEGHATGAVALPEHALPAGQFRQRPRARYWPTGQLNSSGSQVACFRSGTSPEEHVVGAW